VLAAVAPADALQLIGHRGARALAPENTIPGFMTALRIGVSAIETDVVSTKDGTLILRHDARVNPALCTGGYARRYWKNLTLRQVKRLDCGGAHVPTLDQLFRLGRPTGVRYLVEVKRDPTQPRETIGAKAYARKVVAALRRNRAVRRTTVQSFDWRVLREVARIAPRVGLQALASPVTVYPGSRWLGGVQVRPTPFLNGLASAVERAGFDGIGLPQASVSPTLIASAHRRGLQVIPYTVDAPSKMRRLIRAGVDGLISNYPDRLRAAAARTGRSLPPPAR
jgi:glycerophosphoryl diester phosphodiesterase